MNEAAVAYVRDGIALVAFKPFKKHPEGFDAIEWNDPSKIILTEEQAARLPADSNLGLAHTHCKPTPTAAIDLDKLILATEWFAERGVNLVELLARDVRIDSHRENRAKLIYRVEKPLLSIPLHKNGIELRCEAESGRTDQDVLPPSVHPMGMTYSWKNGDFHTLTDMPADVLTAWQGALDDRENKRRGNGEHKQRDDGEEILEGMRNVFLYKKASGLRGGGAEFERILDQLNTINQMRCRPPLPASELRTIARSACRYAPNAGAEETIIMPDEFGGAQLIKLNEDSLAQCFVDFYQDQLRFAHDSGKWHRWDGTRWMQQGTPVAAHWVRLLCRKFNPEGKSILAKASTARAVESFARADFRVALVGDEWDLDPFALGTPGGVVDLQTGTMRPALQNDCITKQTLVAPQAGRPELWLAFLREVTQGDEQLQRYLQQFAGYALTGDCKEEILAFISGPGGSGKSTFALVLSEIWGDYSVASSMDVFISSKTSRHPTDLAALRGARLVTGSETISGRTWDAQRIKSLTGNDIISARFMKQDFFQFRPTCKILLLGNHRPRLDSVDDSYKRRFHIIPMTFRPAKPDLTLKSRLRNEYPQILAWALEGCADWVSSGLVIPDVVKAESESYFQAQNVFEIWLESSCYLNVEYAESNEVLFASWREFADDQSEPAGSGRAFYDRLAEAGFRRIKNAQGIRGRGFSGLRVKPSASDYARASRGSDDDLGR